jgi:hypothetical protein
MIVSKNHSLIVKTKTGLTGTTKGEVINQKIVVHVKDGKNLLCNKKDLEIIGFSD